ncbi:unnamed protein product [Absidia cylindrospora]
MEYGLSCMHCQQALSIPTIRIQLTLAIRSFIRRYYEGWLICDDPTCSNRTRTMSVFGRRCVARGCQGAMTREYTDKQLYTQLLYYSHALDLDLTKKKYMGTPHNVKVTSLINSHQSSLVLLKSVVDSYLNKSAYRHVDLHKLMSLISI